jgi:hypothetical protein
MVLNGSGYDVCVQEITNGRADYPEENAEIYADASKIGLASSLGEFNDVPGLMCFDLGDVYTADSVSLMDATNPVPHANTADGYDVDWVGVCYDILDDETAWGKVEACGDGEDLITDQGNWATKFLYTIQTSQ